MFLFVFYCSELKQRSYSMLIPSNRCGTNSWNISHNRVCPNARGFTFTCIVSCKKSVTECMRPSHGCFFACSFAGRDSYYEFRTLWRTCDGDVRQPDAAGPPMPSLPRGVFSARRGLANCICVCVFSKKNNETYVKSDFKIDESVFDVVSANTSCFAAASGLPACERIR